MVVEILGSCGAKHPCCNARAECDVEGRPHLAYPAAAISIFGTNNVLCGCSDLNITYDWKHFMYEVSPQQMHQATCALPEHFRRLQHQHKWTCWVSKVEDCCIFPVCKTPAALSLVSCYREGSKAPGVYGRVI